MLEFYCEVLEFKLGCYRLTVAKKVGKTMIFPANMNMIDDYASALGVV